MATGQAVASTTPSTQLASNMQGVIDLTKQTLGQGKSQIQDIQHPSPKSGVPFSNSEARVARILAGLNTQARMARMQHAPWDVAKVEAMATAQPELASDLGQPPGTASGYFKDIIGKSLHEGVNVLDMAASQLSRPHQFITKTLLAHAQGQQWQDAAAAGWEGATDYGLHNPKYTGMADVLEAWGFNPGTEYKAPGALPAFNARNMLGFGLDMIVDPAQYVKISLGKYAEKLLASGKYLNPKGTAVLHDMQVAGQFVRPEIQTWLKARGRADLAIAMEQLMPLAEAATKDPAAVAKLKPALMKVYNPVMKEITKGFAEDKMFIPHPVDAGKMVPLQHFDPVLQSSISDNMAAWLEANPKASQGMEDLGGLKIAGMQTPITGKRVKQAMSLIPIPDKVRGLGDSVGKVFSTVYGLPKPFADHLQINYRAMFKKVEYDIRKKLDGIFKGVSLNDRQAITKAIDSGTLPAYLASPEGKHMTEVAKGISDAHLDLWNELKKRNLASEEDKLDNYIFHYYHDSKQVTRVFGGRQMGLTDPRKLDPSLYQRKVSTLADAEVLGLKPEYDAAQLVTMRLMNGWRSIIMKDFVDSTVKRFGIKSEIPEQLAAKIAAKAEGETIQGVERMETRIRAHQVDPHDPARAQEIGQALAYEGSPYLDTIKLLPDDAKRQFMRYRFAKAIKQGNEFELTVSKRSTLSLNRSGPKARPKTF
jgi:predicted transcriptional regulator